MRNVLRNCDCYNYSVTAPVISKVLRKKLRNDVAGKWKIVQKLFELIRVYRKKKNLKMPHSHSVKSVSFVAQSVLFVDRVKKQLRTTYKHQPRCRINVYWININWLWAFNGNIPVIYSKHQLIFRELKEKFPRKSIKIRVALPENWAFTLLLHKIHSLSSFHTLIHHKWYLYHQFTRTLTSRHLFSSKYIQYVEEDRCAQGTFQDSMSSLVVVHIYPCVWGRRLSKPCASLSLCGGWTEY